MTVLHPISIHEALLESHILSLLVKLALQFREYDFYGRRHITTISGPVEESLRNLIHSQAEWRWIVSFDCELGHAPGAQLVLIRDVIVLTPVNVVADRRSREKLDEVGKADEEASVFAILAVDLLTRMHGPFGGLVPPGTCPLDTTVRVADLDKPFRVGAFLVQEYRFGPNQSVLEYLIGHAP